MVQAVLVHVVDPNRERCGAIARGLCARSFCVERHNGLSGFLSRPRQGVVLLSDDSYGPDPVKVLAAIDNRTGHLPAAFFTSSLSLRRALRAMAAGAVDYFVWPCGARELGETVVQVIMHGERRTAVETLKAQALERVQQLTEAERGVLRGLVAGVSNKEMALALGVSPGKLEMIQANMMSRLDAHSVSDAVRIGIYADLDETGANPKRKTAIRAASQVRSTLVG